MKLITWNVNGLRSVFGKGFPEFVLTEAPDVLVLQETKVDPATLEWDWLKGYELLWNRAVTPGYSGTGILTKSKPLSVTRGIGKADMRLNNAMPMIDVHPETYEVRADGELLTCEPARDLPLAQRYFLY